MAVQFIEDRVVAVLKHEMKLPFAPEHLDQIHQVGMFQLLQTSRKENVKEIQSCLDIYKVYLIKLFREEHLCFTLINRHC